MRILIKYWRKQRGMTLKDLNEETEISVSYLSEIENNKANVTFDKLELISNALEVCPRVLIKCDRSIDCEMCSYHCMCCNKGVR